MGYHCFAKLSSPHFENREQMTKLNDSSLRSRIRRKWITYITSFIVLLGILYGFLYLKYDFVWHFTRPLVSDNLGDAREIFFKFKEKEKRFPICMDEVIFSPYNEIYLFSDKVDCFSNLPFRCVTLRNMYYDAGDTKRKVLVSLYKPYRTRLWPFGEMETMILLDDGSICAVSPDEIIEEKPELISVSDTD